MGALEPPSGAAAAPGGGARCDDAARSHALLGGSVGALDGAALHAMAARLGVDASALRSEFVRYVGVGGGVAAAETRPRRASSAPSVDDDDLPSGPPPKRLRDDSVSSVGSGW